MSENTDLKRFGWNDYFEAQFAPYKVKGLHPARVAIENRKGCLLYSEFGELAGEIPGRLYHKSEGQDELPAVGDWVAFRLLEGEKKGVIDVVLPRRAKFSRKVAGTVTEEQIVASNVDTVFIMSSLNDDMNLRRIERYLTMAWDNNVQPVIILSKADLCEDAEDKLNYVESVAYNSPIHVISAKNREGIEELQQYFEGDKTIAVIGSSGVGKSTLINALTDWTKMKVSDISLYKDKGRHTTTHRELIVLPQGGLIIDTPGMREIQLWEGGDGLLETFDDIAALELQCKFTDCKHDSEPGCAVKAALEKGVVDNARLASYKKLRNEIRYVENKQNKKAQLEEKKKWKKISSDAKKKSKSKYE